MSLWKNFLTSLFDSAIEGWYYRNPEFQSLGLVEGVGVLQTIYNHGNIDFERIDNIFKNASDSMTNFIRQNANTSYSAPVKGQVHHYAVCLDVKWGWMAFPASLVALSVIFCVLIIITTTARKSEIWKSSPLAMIYHGPYTRVITTTIDGGRGSAQQTEASLEDNETGKEILGTKHRGACKAWKLRLGI